MKNKIKKLDHIGTVKKEVNRICPKSIKGHCECCIGDWCRYYFCKVSEINYNCDK